MVRPHRREGQASPDDGSVVLLEAYRDGVVESVHRGHVVVVDASGDVLAAAGRADALCYPRSALKPVQAAAVAKVLDEAAGRGLDTRAWAIATASHTGSTDHQVEAARLLALAEIDEGALQCPTAWPDDRAAAAVTEEPIRLAHNCSGKHAAFLLAQAVLGEPLERYLVIDGRLQRLIERMLVDLAGTCLAGLGVDGCGAPAWLLPLDRLAAVFAQAASEDPMAGRDNVAYVRRVAAAMRAHPHLVGGHASDDTRLMQTDPRLIAKRGAEGIFAAGTADGVGLAVKVSDGAARGAGPVAATVLRALGAQVDEAILAPPVLGGGRPRGTLRVSSRVLDVASRLPVAG